MISLFSQKHTKEVMLAIFLLGKNEILLLTFEKKGKRNDIGFFKRQIFISSINNY